MTSVTSNFEAKKLNSPIQRQLIIRFRIKKKKKLNCFVQFSNLKSVCVCVQMKGKNRDIFKKLKKRPQMAQRGKIMIKPKDINTQTIFSSCVGDTETSAKKSFPLLMSTELKTHPHFLFTAQLQDEPAMKNPQDR